MKSIYLPTFFLSWVLVLSGMWIIRPGDTDSSVHEYIYVGAILGFFIVSLIFLSARRKRKKEGLPLDDELSLIVDQKASATSYFSSICLWLGLISIQALTGFELKWIISIGMIGMAYSYIISWLIINSITFKDEK